MKNTEFFDQVNPILEKAIGEGDAVLTIHFSREEDYFRAGHGGMDAGDALIVINRLIEEFELSKPVLAVMLGVNELTEEG